MKKLKRSTNAPEKAITYVATQMVAFFNEHRDNGGEKMLHI